MVRHGLKRGVFVYIAYPVFATLDNLQKAKDNGMKFVIRLPATCKGCGRAIADAVAADNWPGH